MRLHELKVSPGATKSRKRVGRGDGSNWGGTAGRGHKGQRSRSGATIRLHFEGGQTPTFRKLPKVGFTRPYVKQVFEVVNVAAIEKAFNAGDDVTIEAMKFKGILGKKNAPVKILGEGELTKSVKVSANFFSASAKEKIEKAGGSCVVISMAPKAEEAPKA